VGETPNDGTLEVIVPGGGRKRYTVVASVGLRLVGNSDDGGVRLIGEEEAVDADAFWRLWRERNPRGSGLVWESDGTPFDPQPGHDGHLVNKTPEGG